MQEQKEAAEPSEIYDVSDNAMKGAKPQGISAAEKKLLRKLDLYLIPWMCLLYLCSFLDRTNIGNAVLYGLKEDLHMSDGQFYAALSVFFVSYSLLEPLTNVLLKLWRPRIFLTGTIILWGIVMTTMGLCHNAAGLITARFFLGVAEAGLFPGISYYLSCWYKRSEFGVRIAVFFSAAATAGAFGGLLAAAIANMAGIGGKPGWAWIFILEGLATILIGIASWWMVHDFPDQATFLSTEERELALGRLREDKQASAEHENFRKGFLWASIKDWKTYAFAVVYMGCDGSLYAFSLFTPTIIASLGYEGTTANLLSVPPYAVAAVLTIFIGWLADRTNQRGFCNIGVSFLGITGFAMLIGSHNAPVKYAGVYLGALGIYPCISNTIAWAANNVEGSYKRGVTMGFVIGWGNLNGIVASNIFRTNDAPNYYLGFGVVLSYLTLFLCGGSIVTRIALAVENKKRLSGKRDYLTEGKSEKEIDDMPSGDSRPDFIYTL